MDLKDTSQIAKPLAGHCAHQWLDQESPFLVAQLCKLCRLYRYKVAPISDWEYRAPIPKATFGFDLP
ncbi:MAG TPA: hypothetical protein VFJ52_06560 [Terriglobia bacterium]|nr:hypothetical protein [Terriglobia bacterium]